MKEIVQTESFRRWEQNLKDRRANGLAGDIRPVGEGISELRIHFGPGYRVYFKDQGNCIIVLLCGGDKSSQARDILMAKMLSNVSQWQE
ncbi:TPA: type II toxin-antitoxin system RelE/ParE family toxin [Enterobacter hormaechei subsp. xiangfangensis]|uniref:type II toxin-antitoxin system RelE/ParE family toxin n=1 Tax=Enterobacter hormaechei TaxID=158836 RepID=UPI0007951DDE|nr:type II toxin-antitoxin system RelE/ParE family toxin [Enterobacter hormaechei]AYU96155.1 type II toxin-antitoxin system RelE/ParE family toxin [Enterobacter cloacae]KZP80185.1 hypothetical protein A3N47_17245 [Enterobacter hormaechei subsp. xiangfangensis]MBD1276245.1 type II toxin-antitoxin system RelE/ParE family toxin [Enterobacter hormaechei subsp. xiangfangensis]MBT1899066.1 type II toxin-antitoxin system RelE/ParE family toxin [Enterobacter hormaechei subsp. xiangfangensis]MBW7784782